VLRLKYRSQPKVGIPTNAKYQIGNWQSEIGNAISAQIGQ
jgi:hypothetical protein